MIHPLVSYQWYSLPVCEGSFPLGICVKTWYGISLPKKLIEEFAKKVDKLYIFEELEPVIEEQVKAWGIECIGKEIFTRGMSPVQTSCVRKYWDRMLRQNHIRTFRRVRRFCVRDVRIYILRTE